MRMDDTAEIISAWWVIWWRMMTSSDISDSCQTRPEDRCDPKFIAEKFGGPKQMEMPDAKYFDEEGLYPDAK